MLSNGSITYKTLDGKKQAYYQWREEEKNDKIS